MDVARCLATPNPECAAFGERHHAAPTASQPATRAGPARVQAPFLCNARRGPPKASGPAARRPGYDPGPGGVDMADLPGGASGLLARDYKGRKPIGW
jgi:hypothetical protein